MIRYRYVSQLDPPAPFVKISLRCPTTGREAADLPAQVDHGADRTVLPRPVVESMSLVEDGRMSFQGFGSEVLQLPVYLVAVTVHDFPPVEVRAVAGDLEPHILLGRDVLNTLRVVLDGPQLSLEIG